MLKLLVCFASVVGLALAAESAEKRQQEECEANWVGSDCSIYSQSAQPGQNYSTLIDTTQWRFFYANVLEDQILTARLIQSVPDPDCDLDLYMQRDTFPAFDAYIDRDISADTESVLSTQATVGTYFFGVYGYFGPCDLTFTYSFGPACDCNNNGDCVDGKCVCDEGWTDEKCSTSFTLVADSEQHASVDAFGWFNYAIDVGPSQPLMIVIGLMLGGEAEDTHEADLYLAADRIPTLWDYDLRTPGGGEQTNFQIQIPQPVPNTRYFFSVNAREQATYFVTAVILPLNEIRDTCINMCSEHGTCTSENVCECYPEYSGISCETRDSPLVLDEKTRGLVEIGAWNYYNIAFNGIQNAEVHIEQLSAEEDCDLYIKAGLPPNYFNYDIANFTIDVKEFTTLIPNVGNAIWHLAVFGYSTCEYNLTVVEAVDCACAPGAHGSCGLGDSVCVCSQRWGGEDCSKPILPLQNGVVIRGNVIEAHDWHFFSLSVPKSVGLTIAIKELSTTGYVWVYANIGSGTPTLTSYDYSSRSPADQIHQIDIIRPFSDTEVTIGVYASPYATTAVSYDILSWSVPF